MKQQHIVWMVRLVGLVLLALTALLFFCGQDIKKHLGTEPWLGLYPSEMAIFGVMVAIACSLRSLVFGLSIRVRLGVVFFLFFALATFISFLPEITHDTSPWADLSVEYFNGFFVFPVAGISLIFAAIPMFDRRMAEGRLEN